MKVTPSQLRANVYRILDEVLESGTTVEIEHKGRILRIVLDQPRAKLERLVERPEYTKGDP